MEKNIDWIKAGDYLRELRKRKGLSLLKVAREIGVSGNYISLIERGKRQPSMLVIHSLADFYNVDPQDICILYHIGYDGDVGNMIRNEALRRVLTQMSTDKHFTDDDLEIISKKLHDILDKEGFKK